MWKIIGLSALLAISFGLWCELGTSPRISDIYYNILEFRAITYARGYEDGYISSDIEHAMNVIKRNNWM